VVFVWSENGEADRLDLCSVFGDCKYIGYWERSGGSNLCNDIVLFTDYIASFADKFLGYYIR
jgi:hypothetical protein